LLPPIFLVFGFFHSTAQVDSSTQKIVQSFNSISEKSLHILDNKYNSLNKLVQQRTEKMLKRMQERESRLQEQMKGKDSVKAKQLFAESQHKYQQLQAKLQSPPTANMASSLKSYIPGIDSMQTALKFLSQGNDIAGISPEKLQHIAQISQQLTQLQGKLQVAGEAQEFINQREQQLKDQLFQYGFGKQLLGINKQAFYFQQEVANYKEAFSTSEKREQAILTVVRQIPAFQSFWQKYSILAQLFPMPSDFGSAAALNGLQTNAQVTALIRQQMGGFSGASSGLPNMGTPVPQQYLDQAQSQMDQVKDKLSSIGGNNSSMTMPDFKPDKEHGKSILKRLVFGFNMQTSPATTVLPTISDIGISLGVKAADNIQFGVGGSYKLGVGSIKCFHFSNEGISSRAYLDIRAKSQIWITGGWEYNYLQSFKSLQEVYKYVQLWQRSALLGITKKYKVGKKTGNMQLLYDFLAAEQVPTANPIKIRFGYSF
jgi:hypothetical protein